MPKDPCKVCHKTIGEHDTNQTIDCYLKLHQSKEIKV